MEITKKDLIARFTHYPPTEVKGRIHMLVRDAVFSCAVFILKMTPPCREQSLALTKLEEVMFWANAAIARYPLTIDSEETGENSDAKE